MDLARAHLVPSAFGAGLLHGTVYQPQRAHEVGYLDELAEPGAVLPAPARSPPRPRSSAASPTR